MPKPTPIVDPSLRARHVPSSKAVPHQRPVLGKEGAKQDDSWGFSFRYWRQIENFGLGDKDVTWFASLLDKLCEISKLPLRQLQSDGALKHSLRIHPIDWRHTNIPIKRQDLHWLPEDFLINEGDYPLLQFSITKGLGRVSGFWHQAIFHIVLIDPHHNLQPAGDYNFQVTPTTALENELETIIANLGHIENSGECTPTCGLRAQLRLVRHRHQQHGIVYIKQEYLDCLHQMIKDGNAKSLEDCIENIILEKDSK